MGFEPMTSSLPRKCSTPELRRLIQFAVYTTYCLTERKKRFELSTYSLEGYRSTNWATSAFSVRSLQLPACILLLTENW